MNLTLPAEEAQQRDAFIERMLDSVRGLFDIFAIYIGDQMGFYQALAANGPATSLELASWTNAHERYVREWLEQQTVFGILEVKNPDASPVERCFRLSTAHSEVLTDVDSLNYLAPLSQLAVSVTRPLDALLNAYQKGGGVPFAEYGRDLRIGQGNMNRTMFLQQLGAEWLPSIPDVHTRLQADPPALVADIGCGLGWSSIGITQAYPNAQVDGFDLDGPSIEMAREHAAGFGLNGRLNFHVRDAGDPALAGRYDLVTAFECVHDMSNPVSALRTMRRLAGETGAVIVVDERVGDVFTPDGNEVEWMMYGWSVLHCLPVGMAEEPSAATGTVMRTDTLRQYAREAGFRELEVLPIDNFFFRFYRLWI
jgi:2-polyprenyl-3-methyl-5-hydroxy-6-metoxy-1,4-benzoquinol methylase